MGRGIITIYVDLAAVDDVSYIFKVCAQVYGDDVVDFVCSFWKIISVSDLYRESFGLGSPSR